MRGIAIFKTLPEIDCRELLKLSSWRGVVMESLYAEYYYCGYNRMAD